MRFKDYRVNVSLTEGEQRQIKERLGKLSCHPASHIWDYSTQRSQAAGVWFRITIETNLFHHFNLSAESLTGLALAEETLHNYLNEFELLG